MLSDPEIDTLIENYALLIDYEKRIYNLHVTSSEDTVTLTEIAHLNSKAAALRETIANAESRLEARGVVPPAR